MIKRKEEKKHAEGRLFSQSFYKYFFCIYKYVIFPKFSYNPRCQDAVEIWTLRMRSCFYCNPRSIPPPLLSYDERKYSFPLPGGMKKSKGNNKNSFFHQTSLLWQQFLVSFKFVKLGVGWKIYLMHYIFIKVLLVKT